jgi:phospholipid transport system substrate-binding protein
MTQIHGLFVRQWCRLPVLSMAVAALVLGAHPALAQDSVKDAPSGPLGPLDQVKSSVARVMAIVQSQPDGAQRRAEVRQEAERLFDFNEMARRTLGQHWAARSGQEQEEFVRLFTDLLERSYLTTIGNQRLATVTYQGESVDGSSARVRSRLVTDRGTEIPVEYRLLQSRTQWSVYDISVEGVSLVSSYRSQFNSIIRNSSFALLLERMRSREAHLTPGPNQGP